MTMVVCQVLPLRIISEANTRGHWSAKAKRAKQHRLAARLLLAHIQAPDTTELITITLTRIAPKAMDDDNLAGGFKATRDGVADWLGIDDGSKRLRWIYKERRGGVRHYAAEVVVQWEVTA